MKTKLNALAPLISSILLVLTTVILIIILVSWGKDFTIKETEKTNNFFTEDPTLTGFIYPNNLTSEGFTIKNLSQKSTEITHYEIISSENLDILNKPLPLSSPITLTPGSKTYIPVICSPSSNYIVNLITEDHTYISVEINGIINYNSNSCSNNPNVPDLVCLGLNENGSGDTNSDPIIICDVDDLNAVRNNLGKHHKLGRNLDLNTAPYNDGNGWIPIGDNLNQFVGVFDGAGHIISNLYINRPETEMVGLFGKIMNSEINNLILKDYNILGAANVGSIVGNIVGNSEYSTISNCSTNGVIYSPDLYGTDFGGVVGSAINAILFKNNSEGEISGNFDSVGGIVGSFSNGTISENTFSGSISGNGVVGGIVGDFTTGEIIGSSVNAQLSGETVGGIVGDFTTGGIYTSFFIGDINASSDAGGIASFYQSNDCGKIENCFAVGSINLIGDWPSSAGGLFADSDGNVTNSFANVDVTGNYDAGGLIGCAYGNITNCYSLGNVTRISSSAYTDFGGFIGEYGGGGNISNSYSIGKVIYDGATNPNNKGFLGYTDEDLDVNNYFDVNASLQTSTVGNALGKTTSEMKTQNTFTDWDFTDVWAIDSSKNDGYPYLINNPPR